MVSYNQESSAAYARLVTRGLRAEGYRVIGEQVDFALPDFRAVAADLKQQGADLVLDAIDTHGNAQLCKAMDELGVRVLAKVTNVQNWTSTVPGDYKGAPHCRNSLWATGSSRNYEDVSQPSVREFRDATGSLATHSQWQLEGWAAAEWFTDAATSCAATGITRACVDAAMARGRRLTAGGLLLPVSFQPLPKPPATHRTCLSVARWQDGRGWVSQGDMNRTCFDVPQLAYTP